MTDWAGGAARVLVVLAVLTAGVALALWSGGGPVGAQVPTTLPTTAPTTSPPTTSPPTTSRPTPTTSRPPATTAPAPSPDDPGADQSEEGEPAPTSARPPATGGASSGGGDDPGPSPVSGIDPAQLGGEEDPLITSSASGKLPAVFSWLALLGAFFFVALLGLQWALTNPARRGSRTL